MKAQLRVPINGKHKLIELILLRGWLMLAEYLYTSACSGERNRVTAFPIFFADKIDDLRRDNSQFANYRIIRLVHLSRFYQYRPGQGDPVFLDAKKAFFSP